MHSLSQPSERKWSWWNLEFDLPVSKTERINFHCTRFAVICYSSPRKLIQHSNTNYISNLHQEQQPKATKVQKKRYSNIGLQTMKDSDPWELRNKWAGPMIAQNIIAYRVSRSQNKEKNAGRTWQNPGVKEMEPRVQGSQGSLSSQKKHSRGENWSKRTLGF